MARAHIWWAQCGCVKRGDTHCKCRALRFSSLLVERSETQDESIQLFSVLLKGIELLEDLDVEGRIILKCLLKNKVAGCGGNSCVSK
jgi:hypothetical protein